MVKSWLMAAAVTLGIMKTGTSFASDPLITYKGFDETGQQCSLRILDFYVDESTGQETGAWVEVNYSDDSFSIFYPDSNGHYDTRKMWGYVGDHNQAQVVALFFGPLGSPASFAYADNTGTYATHPYSRNCLLK